MIILLLPLFDDRPRCSPIGREPIVITSACTVPLKLAMKGFSHGPPGDYTLPAVIDEVTRQAAEGGQTPASRCRRFQSVSRSYLAEAWS
jgi:hypothetical protein